MADLIDEIIEAVELNIDGRDCEIRLKYARQAVMEQIRAAPLTDILDALGHTYREGWLVENEWGWTVYDLRDEDHPDVGPNMLVVDNPATDEAQA